MYAFAGARGPILRLQFAGLARHLQWIKAGTHQVEDSRILQIGPEHIVKRLGQRLRER